MRDPLTRFSNRAVDYAKYRPSYPDAALDFIFDGLGGTLTVADIGAGTGISSRLMAQRGCHVIGIEPNAAMRLSAEPHVAVEYREGTGEATGLGDDSIDLVTCFQSYHWLRSAEAMAEFQRVLRTHGRVALVWNLRDLRDPLTSAYDAAIELASGRGPEARRGPGLGEEFLSDARYANRLAHAFGFRERLDREAFIGRARSESHMPTGGEAYERCLQTLDYLHARHKGSDGRTELAYLTYAFRADVG